MSSSNQDPAPKLAAEPSAEAQLALAGIAHDVNQMLGVITGRVGLLLKANSDPSCAPHLEAIQLAAADAALILGRINPARDQLAAAESGALVREAAEQARLMVWPVASGKLTWQNEVDPALVCGVPAQVLREVLSNLILNAVEAMAETGCVTVSASTLTPQKIEVRIADNGPGIFGDALEKVFQAGVTRTGEVGRGIGLAGCRQLLTSVGGRIRAESVAGEGAVFVLELPLGREIADPAAGIDHSALPSMTVLVVDDEQVVREMLVDVLRDWGCEVLSFRDAASALSQYKAGSAAVALVDVNLPGMGGLELATRLRQDDSCLGIMTMTGWQNEASVESGQPEAVDLETLKPLALDGLYRALLAAHKLNQDRRGTATGQ